MPVLALVLYGVALILFIYIVFHIIRNKKLDIGDAIGILSILVSILIALNITSGNTHIDTPITVNITSKKGWQPTGIQIEVGDKFEIRYKEGQWKGTASGAFYGPDPLFSDTPSNCLPLKTDPGALIGMIGNYQPFKVGNLFQTPSSLQSGELLLSMNDCYFDDNSGSLNIIIEFFK